MAAERSKGTNPQLQCATCVGFLVPPIRSDHQRNYVPVVDIPRRPRPVVLLSVAKRLIAERGYHGGFVERISTSSSEHLSRGKTWTGGRKTVWRWNGCSRTRGSIFPPFSPRGEITNKDHAATTWGSLLLSQVFFCARAAFMQVQPNAIAITGACYRLVGSNKHKTAAEEQGSTRVNAGPGKVTYLRP